MSKKMWGGRFTRSIAPVLEKLNNSIDIDKRLFREDIFGSKKYANALGDAGILSKQEVKDICDGLEQVEEDWEKGDIEILPGDEDIHTLNERKLQEIIGSTAAKLHTGRSRNDQVITDMKLWLSNTIELFKIEIVKIVQNMNETAKEEIDILMPGYTHLQRAQPVRWSHWLLSHAWNLKVDVDRLESIKDRVNICPLGSGAIAGNPFHINREKLADELNFSGVTMNSMQAIGDRDFIVEFLFWASLCAIHLSRLAEDLILFSSKEFGYINIDDAFMTGSSLMPQKRNPDSLELIRGTAGYICGHMTGFMMSIKGLPSTYNKDMQNDKESAFAVNDRLLSTLQVMGGVLKSLTINPDNCEKALSFDMLTTDIAYYLVRKGVAFRDAHHTAGKLVALAERKHVTLPQLSINDYKEISNIFEDDIMNIWNFEESVEQYQTTGGTGKEAVLSQIDKLHEWVFKKSDN